MSSGPSQECLNGRSSGTILLSIISMSSLTSGSQFSLMASEAEVWSNCMCISPTENCESSGSWKTDIEIGEFRGCRVGEGTVERNRTNSPPSGSPQSPGGPPCAEVSGGLSAAARRSGPQSGQSRGGSRDPSLYCGWQSTPSSVRRWWRWWRWYRTIKGLGEILIQEREERGGRSNTPGTTHTWQLYN